MVDRNPARFSGFRMFSGTSNPGLAEAIAHYLHASLSRIDIHRFTDGEVYVAPGENVRGSDLFFVQPTCPPLDSDLTINDGLMELLIAIDAFRRASAERITAVIPYYGYARQEKKDAAREPITARLVADLLEAAGVDRAVTIDLHAGAIQGFFKIPVDHLTALPLFGEYFLEKMARGLSDVTVVAPDAGRVKAAEKLADYLNVPLTVVYKHRPRQQEVEVTHVVGDIQDRVPIIFEDIVATGGTLVECVNALLQAGARPEIQIAVTHPVLTGNAVARLDRPEITEIVVTDTIPLPEHKRVSKITVLSVASLLGEAIRAIHNNLSVSALFDGPQPEPTLWS